MAGAKSKLNRKIRENRLRRQIVKTAKSRSGPSKGGGFNDLFKPPSADDDFARIVMFKPEKPYKIKLGYKKKTKTMAADYGVLFEHYNASKRRGCRCTAGMVLCDDGQGDHSIEVGDDVCVPCHEMSTGSSDHISRRKVHIFNIVKLGWYHEVEEKSKSGRTYKTMVQCGGKRCKYCKDGIERTYGKRMYWPLGKSHIGNLMHIEANSINRNCTCGAGKLKTKEFVCEECGEIVRDLEDDPPENKAELENYRDSEIECPHCEHVGFPFEVFLCRSKKCKDPKPLSIWDVVLEVYRSGEKTQSSIQCPDFEILDKKTLSRIKDKMTPYNWDEVWQYRPLKTEEQAALFEIEDPYSSLKKKKSLGASEWEDEEDEDDDEENEDDKEHEEGGDDDDDDDEYEDDEDEDDDDEYEDEDDEDEE